MSHPLSALLLGALALAAAPASALAAGPAWTDAGAEVPASASLKAVAAYQSGGDDVVVAVGRDDASDQAVIYRYSSGAWQQDTIPGAPADSCLVAVAVDQQAAWAVGSQGGGCSGDAAGSGKALLLRFAGGGDALATQVGSASWSTVDPSTVDPTSAGASLAPASAVALSGTGGELVVGSQAIYSFSDGAPPSFSTVGLTPAPSAVNGVALYGPQSGYVVGARSDGIDIFDLSSSAVGDTSAPFAPPAPRAPLAGVAALSATNAIAIEGKGTSTPGWWAPDSNGVWERHGDGAFASGTLSAVSIGQAASTTEDPTPAIAEAIAGTDSFGQGTVWQWTVGGSSLTQSTVACAALNGIAVLGSEDMWAVGDDGTLLHYTASGDPAAGCALPSVATSTSPGGGSGGGGSDGGSGSTTASGPSSTPSGSSPGSSPAVTVTVTQPVPPPSGSRKPTRGSTHKKRRRPLLIKDVRVRVERGRLLVVCKLTAPARVSAVARRSGRVVGRAGWQRFRGGTCRLIVPYQGTRPPAQLQVFALPLAHLSSDQSKPRLHNPAP